MRDHCFSEKWSEEVCRMKDCRSALMPVLVASVPVASAQPTPLSALLSLHCRPPSRHTVYIISSAVREEITDARHTLDGVAWRGWARGGARRGGAESLRGEQV